MSHVGSDAIIDVGGTLVAELTDYEDDQSAARRDVSFTNNAGAKTYRTEPVEYSANWTAFFVDGDAAMEAIQGGATVSIKIQVLGAGSGLPQIAGDYLVTRRRVAGTVNGEVTIAAEGVFNTYDDTPQA